jgi:hypothetical protein
MARLPDAKEILTMSYGKQTHEPNLFAWNTPFLQNMNRCDGRVAYISTC